MLLHQEGVLTEDLQPWTGFHASSSSSVDVPTVPGWNSSGAPQGSQPVGWRSSSRRSSSGRGTWNTESWSAGPWDQDGGQAEQRAQGTVKVFTSFRDSSLMLHHSPESSSSSGRCLHQLLRLLSASRAPGRRAGPHPGLRSGPADRTGTRSEPGRFRSKGSFQPAHLQDRGRWRRTTSTSTTTPSGHVRARYREKRREGWKEFERIKLTFRRVIVDFAAGPRTPPWTPPSTPPTEPREAEVARSSHLYTRS